MDRYAAPAMPLVLELRAAVGLLTALGPPAGAPRPALAGALAFFPVVGLALGAVAAGVATLSPVAGGALGVLVLVALTGGRGVSGLAAAMAALLRPAPPATALARLRAAPPPLALAAAVAVLALRAAAAAALPGRARATALVIAPMLGAWAIVVQCYGGTPANAQGAAAALVGRARFREFGWASVVALGATLATGEAVGLLVVLVASLTTVAVRLHAHHRLGGLTGRLLWATRELVETAVLVTLAVLPRAGP